MKRNLKINLERKPWSFDMRSNIIIRKIFVKVEKKLSRDSSCAMKL